MAYDLPVDHSDVPIRLFKSNFLEFFTHITPLAVIIVWAPVMIGAMVWSVFQARYLQVGYWHLPAAFIVGALLWTFAEYMLHRFLFHHQAKSERAKRIFFLFHGVHHAQPQCKTRLVMPPVVSIPLAVVMYGLILALFSGLLGLPHWTAPIFSGFVAGYLFYDLTHYAIHHLPMRSGMWKFLKRYHMLHHYKTPCARFGVSSPCWDIMFRTRPMNEEKRKSQSPS